MMKTSTMRLPFLVFSVAFVGALTASLSAVVLSDEELKKIRDHVVAERPYELGTEVEITLSEGEAVRLNCAANPYGIGECIIHRVFSGIVHMIVFDINGTRLNMQGASVTSEGGAQSGAFGAVRCVRAWRVEDDKVIVTLRTTKEIIRRQWPSLSELERIAGFARLWSEVKYNFAFFDQVPEVNWDNVLDEYLPRVMEAKSTTEYYDVLRECISRLHDGHTEAWGPRDVRRGKLPFEVRAYQGRALIVRIFPIEKIKDQELYAQLSEANLQVGEEITHIDGRSVREVLEQDLYPYIFASTSHARDNEAYPQLTSRGEPLSQAKLRIKDLDGSIREVTLKRTYYDFDFEQSFMGFECRDLVDGIVYVNLPDFGYEGIIDDFDKVFPQVKQAQGLIVDVRNNTGGSSRNGYAIISYLIDKPIKGSKWKTRQYMPAFRAWEREEAWYEAAPRVIEPKGDDPFLGPVVVLTSVETCSAAEDFVVALHAGKRARIVGGRTRGSTGQPLYIDLPGGGGARICTKRDTYPDGREFVGVGIIPDVEIYPTPTDIAADRDVVLLKGIEELKTSKERILH